MSLSLISGFPTSVLSLQGEEDLHLASRREMKPERRTSDSDFCNTLHLAGSERVLFPLVYRWAPARSF